MQSAIWMLSELSSSMSFFATSTLSHLNDKSLRHHVQPGVRPDVPFSDDVRWRGSFVAGRREKPCAVGAVSSPICQSSMQERFTSLFVGWNRYKGGGLFPPTKPECGMETGESGGGLSPEFRTVVFRLLAPAEW
jgi:hypothetical protein